MKRLLAILLCFSIMLCFAGCGSDKKTEPKGIDVEYYANLGKMPESDYALGEDTEKITSELEELYSSDPDGEMFVTTSEVGDYTSIMADGINYFYKTDKASEGISYIVSFGGAYGFENGTVSIEVKDSLASYGFETAERDVDKKEAFFVLGSAEGMTCLEYEFKKNAVMFVFQENSLIATALFKKENN